jgi:hypothetical protein
MTKARQNPERGRPGRSHFLFSRFARTLSRHDKADIAATGTGALRREYF